MKMIQTTTRRSDRRMPGHCRRNVGYSHIDQQWFFLVILTDLIFFRGQQSNRAAGPLSICFRSRLRGHFRTDCQAQINNRVPEEFSVQQQFFQYPQSIGWSSAALPTMQTESARKAGN